MALSGANACLRRHDVIWQSLTSEPVIFLRKWAYQAVNIEQLERRFAEGKRNGQVRLN